MKSITVTSNFIIYSVAIILLTQLFACAGTGNNKPQTDQPGLSTKTATSEIEQNKALVLKFYQLLNDTNWTALRQFVDPDYKHYYQKDSGFASMGWSGFERGNKGYRNAFPDWKLTPITIVAEGEYVSVRLVGSGTHTRDFAGVPATNKKVAGPLMLMHQIRNGKMIADWEMINTAAFLDQLKN